MEKATSVGTNDVINDDYKSSRTTCTPHMTHERITMNPDVMFGKPVIRGTRITVEQILRKLAAGLSAERILMDHPHLTVEDVQAAAGFAADYLAQEDIVFAAELRS